MGVMAGRQVVVLKDDGCNTNVISKSFVDANRHLLDVRLSPATINHSNKNSVEETNEIVIDAEVEIGSHKYRSNWIVSDCRYDVLLGMPWHNDVCPRMNYETGELNVKTSALPLHKDSSRAITVSNMGIKKFRSLLRKKKHNSEDFMVFQVRSINQFTMNTDVGKKGSKDPEIVALEKEFSTVFRDDLPDELPPERDVDHKIETLPDSSPPHRGIFQLSPAELLATKEYIMGLLKKKKIRHSKSPYGAPLFFVKQKGQLRGVIDYRALNRITKHNNAPIPRTDEMFDRLGRARFYSKLDLKTGFHQIRINPADVEKTAFKTKYGQFEFLVMPMGLRNAPATFQALMNSIFRDCIDDFIVVYMDDILIFSESRDDHLKHLRIVLSRLRDHQLYVGRQKYELMTEETEFLGLIVGREGVRIGDDRKQLVKDWPIPKTTTELRSFLGLVQFFRRFIQDFSRIAAPLTNLTRKYSNISLWNEQCTVAFDSLKESLISAPIMRAPDWSKSFRCHTDASQVAVGGTLTQISDDGNEHAVSFFSKRLSPAEENYSANDRELLGLVYFLQRFRCYLEGAEFEVLTDNQVLKYFFTKQNLSRREARWLDFLGQFGITHLTLIRGRVHVLGDVPSRAPHAPTSHPTVNNINFEVPMLELPDDFRDNYQHDLIFGDINRALQGEEVGDKTKTDRISRLLPHFSLEDGLLYYEGMLCVPRNNVKDIMELAHDNKTAGHFGYTKTLSRLAAYHWKNKASDVFDYCKGCITCQTNKDGRVKPLGIPQPLELPDRRWGSISMDFVTHLPPTDRGYDCITTFVDRFSKRVRLIPSKCSDTAEDVAKCFFDNIFKIHGLPDSIVSDRDPKFTSRFWSSLMDHCGIKLRMSTSRHPQTDGSTEVMNRMIGNYLRCYCAFNQTNWDDLLTTAEFSYNSATVDSMTMSPFEADLGWKPRSPLELFRNRKEENLHSVSELKATLEASFQSALFAQRLAQARQAAYNAKRYTPPSYNIGDKIYLSRKLFTDASSAVRPSQKLSVRRVGPFRVVEIINNNAVRIDLPPSYRIHPVIHVEHTARAYEQPLDIGKPVPPPSQPFIDITGEEVVEIERILSHRRKGRGWQFLALIRNAPLHEAVWKPLRDFVDDDRTITAALHAYIVQHGILHHLH